jgi:hypothetical protein
MKRMPNRILLVICSALFLSGCAGLYPSNPDASNQEAASLAREREEMCSNLRREMPSYSADYLKRVVQVLGTCQKAMDSPRYLMGQVYADASGQLDSLKLDFPQQRATVAGRELETIVIKLGALVKLPLDPDDYPSGRYGYLAAAKPLTDYVTANTKAMRDVLLNQ